MRKVLIVTTLLFSIICGYSAQADIIRLKRGMSFEGKLLEEKADSYVFEMNLGVVNFTKDEVESVEFYSEVDNKQMVNQWAEIDVKDTALQKDDFIDVQSEVENNEQMVRYKGRYVTPEVYKIIEKEREVRERRYKFIQDKKIQEEQTQAESSAKDELFRGTVNKLGSKGVSQSDLGVSFKTKSKPYSSGRDYGSVDMDRSL